MELSRLVRHHAVRDSLCARDPSSVSKNREIERDRDAIATRARATRVQPRATRRVMFFLRTIFVPSDSVREHGVRARRRVRP